MASFKKNSFGKKVLAAVLCVMVAALSAPMGLGVSVTAAPGDLRNFKFTVQDYAGSAVDGAMINLTNTRDAADSATGTTNSSGAVIFVLTEGDTYEYQVSKSDYFALPQGTVTIPANDDGEKDVTLYQKPKIITQPSISGVITTGATLTLSIEIEKPSLVSEIQWYKNDTPITGATATSLIIAPVSLSDAGRYSCRLTGLGGAGNTVDSNTVDVEVKVATTLTLFYQPNPIKVEDNVTLTAVLKETVSGSAISGATITFNYDGGSGTAMTDSSGSASITFTAPSAVATYSSLMASYAGNATYTAVADERRGVTVSLNEINATVSLAGWTYGETAKTPSVNGLPTDYRETPTYAYSNEQNGTYTSAVPTDAGTYWVKASLPATSKYSAFTTDPVSFVIAQKSVTVIILVDDKYYDATNKAWVSGIRLNPDDILSGDTLGVSFKTGRTDPAANTVRFNSVNANTAQPLSFIDTNPQNNFELTGASAGNYNIALQQLETATAAIVQWSPTIQEGTHFTVSTATGALHSAGVDYGWYKKDEEFVIRAAGGYQLSLSNNGTGWQPINLPPYTNDTAPEGNSVSFYVLDNGSLDTDTIGIANKNLGTPAISGDKTVTYQLDHTPPEPLKVIYKTTVLDTFLEILTFGFYNPAVTICLEADDATSGVKSFNWEFTPQSGTASALNQAENHSNIDATRDGATNTYYTEFTLTASELKQYRGSITFTASDTAGNRAAHNESNYVVVVDTISPNAKIMYTNEWADRVDASNNSQSVADGNTRFVSSGKIAATIQVSEANFDLRDPADFVVKVKKNGESFTDFQFDNLDSAWVRTPDTDIYTNETFEIPAPLDHTGDGDYVIEISFKDRSKNDADWAVENENTGNGGAQIYTYTSNILTISTAKPAITTDYDPDSSRADGLPYPGIFDAPKTIRITVKDRNFRPTGSGFVLSNLNLTNLNRDEDALYTLTKADGTKVDLNEDDLAAALQDWSSWEKTVASVNGSAEEWETEITFSADGAYSFELGATNIAGNSAEPCIVPNGGDFIIDKTAPKDLSVTYDGNLKNVWDVMVSGLTFGFFGKPEPGTVHVTVSADDITAGIDYFAIYSADEKDDEVKTPSIRIPQKKNASGTNSFSYSFDIEPQYRGRISVTAFDKAGNSANSLDAENRDTGHNSDIAVVDTISPVVQVEYTMAGANKLHFVNGTTQNDEADQTKFTSADTVAYYNGSINAKITVNGENFFDGKLNQKNGQVIHNIIVMLEKTANNGSVSKIEFVPTGAAATVTGATKVEFDWAQTPGTDEWTYTLPAYVDDADYVLKISYTDLSDNKADVATDFGDMNYGAGNYTSNRVTIDTQNPVVSVSYSPNKVIHDLNSPVYGKQAKYYDTVQTATITIVEHNFRADDVAASIAAKDIAGRDAAASLISSLTAHLRNRGSWEKNGDQYTATITYSADANYTFDVRYEDLARRNIAPYAQDVFTVDTSVPTNLTVSYSTPLIEMVLQSVTFGFYNAKATVTVTAEDDTAGIYRFVYDYRRSAGVSRVNAELIDGAISNAEIQYSNQNKTATARFEIPKAALRNDNQFNGTIQFTAYDRAENSTQKADNRREVVDNIAPNATITYNAPFQTANGTAYYAGNITGTVNITEANFFKDDVTVSVRKNGGAATALPTSWRDASADEHVGTFTLTEDGDYVVTVTYKDRSRNQMADYESNRLTIDTQKPVIQVDGISNQSANNKDTIGFTITAGDESFDVSKFDVDLTAVVMDVNGVFKTITLPSGSVKTITAGKEYTYTIENLSTDGIYSLTCSASDLSGNTTSDIVVSDSGEKSMQTVEFSVNRHGSTFMLDDDTTRLVETYYVQDAYKDVVVIEINADSLQSYKAVLNGSELKEDADYSVTQSGGSGGWNKYTYNLKRSLFGAEGEYKVVVSSIDKAQNDAYSDIKSAEVNFVVDQTPPVVTLSGLKAGGRYQVATQTVTVVPKDDGGKLQSLKVIVTDNGGNAIRNKAGEDISVRLDLSEDELLSLLESNDGKLTFEIPSGLGQNVQILCSDCAQNDEGEINLYEATLKNVTVSANVLIIFYANKPLFYGSIGGVVLIAGLLIFLLVFRRRKNAEANPA